MPTLPSMPVTKAYADGLVFSVVLPAQVGSAGKFVKTDGVTAGWFPVDPQWVIKTSDYVASSGDALLFDTTLSALVLTLPSAPSANDSIQVADYSGTFALKNLTLNRNGKNIMGLSEDMLISRGNVRISLIYINATQGWRIL